MTNVLKLAIHKMSVDAVPAGGGLNAALNFLSTKESIKNGFQEARKWTEMAILAVRQANDPNPWREASDEDIAGELLRLIEELKKKQQVST